MNKLATLITLPFICLSLISCASVVNGTTQKVTVATGNTIGAHCSLANSKGNWLIPSTPGSTVVKRSSNDLKINCQKKGYLASSLSVNSKTKPIIAGNLLIGGLIGAGVDMIDGAAYGYPDQVNMKMQRA